MAEILTSVHGRKMGFDARGHLVAPGGMLLEEYTVATVPAAASHEGVLIRVTDGDAGSDTLAFSDGTDWLVVALGSAIATS